MRFLGREDDRGDRAGWAGVGQRRAGGRPELASLRASIDVVAEASASCCSWSNRADRTHRAEDEEEVALWIR